MRRAALSRPPARQGFRRWKDPGFGVAAALPDRGAEGGVAVECLSGPAGHVAFFFFFNLESCLVLLPVLPGP